MKKIIKHLTGFPSNKSLFSLPIVWICFWIPFAISLYSAVEIIIQGSFYFSPNYEGFNHAASVFKFSITAAGLSLALIGLCAANHRSEQAKDQMALTSSQNIFSNHFKHLEEFEKYLTSSHQKNLSQREKIIKKHESAGRQAMVETVTLLPHINEHKYRNLYRKIYPLSKKGVFSVDDSFAKYIDNFISEIEKCFKEFGTSPSSEKSNRLVSAFDKLEEFKKNLYIEDESFYRPQIHSTPLMKKLRTEEGNDLIFSFVFLIDCIDMVLHFDTSYIPTEKIKWIDSIDFEKIPSINLNRIDVIPNFQEDEIFPIKK